MCPDGVPMLSPWDPDDGGDDGDDDDDDDGPKGRPPGGPGIPRVGFGTPKGRQSDAKSHSIDVKS